MSTRSFSLMFFVVKRSRYVSASFLVSPFWILSISGQREGSYFSQASMQNKQGAAPIGGHINNIYTRVQIRQESSSCIFFLIFRFNCPLDLTWLPIFSKTLCFQLVINTSLKAKLRFFLFTCQDFEWSTSGLVIWAIILSVLIINSAAFRAKTQKAAAYVLAIVTACCCFLIFNTEIRTLLWSKSNTCQQINKEKIFISWNLINSPGNVPKHRDPAAFHPR